MTGSVRSASISSALVALLVLAAPTTAQEVAQEEDSGFGFAPVAGINIDAEELFLGAEFWIPMVWDAGAGQVYITPVATWYPFAGEDVAGVDIDASSWSLGGDLVWAFGGESFAPFVRGGPMLAFTSSEVAGVRNSDTTFRLNLAAGGFFGMPGSNRPFAQLGVLLGDGSALYGEAGYRFGF